MNEEIHCITNGGKTAKNEWEIEDSDFLHKIRIAIHRMSNVIYALDLRWDFSITFSSKWLKYSAIVYIKKLHA